MLYIISYELLNACTFIWVSYFILFIYLLMSSTWNETEERFSRGNPNLCFACEGGIRMDQPENAVKHFY